MNSTFYSVYENFYIESLTQKEEPQLNLLLWQLTTTSYKTRKTNLNFCLNFCAGEPHTKVRAVFYFIEYKINS